MESHPSLRSRIAGAFNDEDLRAFCFDHFPMVYNTLTIGMTKGQMIQILLDHCMRHQAGRALLTALEQERPGLVGADRDALLAQLDAARLGSASAASLASDSSGQTIINQAPNQGAQGIFHGPVHIGIPSTASHQPTANVSQDKEKIAQQQERLELWRTQLHGLLNQLAIHGEAWAPPGLTAGIRNARAEIAKIKQTLLGWSVAVTDDLDDEA